MRDKKKIVSSLLFSATILSLFALPVATVIVRADEPGQVIDQPTGDSADLSSRKDYVDSLAVKDTTNTGNYLSTDTAPNHSNILSTIVYSYAAEGVTKSTNIGFSDMENFARALVLDGTNTNYYNYKSAATIVDGSDEEKGGELASDLKGLYDNGILISERERAGLIGYWDKATNTFGKFTKSVGTVWVLNATSGFTFITEPLGNLAREAQNMVLETSDNLSPTSVFGYVGTIDYGTSDFGQLMKIIVEEVIGTGDTFRVVVRSIVLISTGLVSIIGIVSVYYQFSKGKVSESFKAVRKYALMIIVPTVFTATLPSYAAFRQDIENSIVQNQAQVKVAADENLIIDVKKWAFVSNFAGMGSLADGNVTGEAISKLNQDLNDRLAGAKDLGDMFETDQSTLDKLLGGETFTANQYISFIQKASKSDYQNGNIQANVLPAGISWGDNNTPQTFWVSPYNPLHPYVGDTVSVTGIARFIDNSLSKSNSVGSDSNTLDQQEFLKIFLNPAAAAELYGTTPEQAAQRGLVVEKNKISYNYQNYSFTEVRRSNAWTYIYGGRSNGSYMSSLLDNYTFGSSLTLADDLTEKVGRGVKADGSDSKVDENGKLADKGTDYYLQLSNALKIAIFNRYAGVSDPGAAAVEDNLSNQSTFFLLSSHINKDGLEVYLKNNNFNESDQGKAGSNSEVWYNRYVMPAKDKNDFFAKLGIINSQSLAISIISIGAFIAVLRTNLGSLVFPIWVYFKNIYMKGSILALSMFYISDMTLLLLKSHSRLVLSGFYNMFGSITNRINSGSLFSSTSAFGVTALLAFIALMIVWPFFSVKGGKKQSFLELFLNLVVVLRDSAVEPLQKMENALYGKTIDQGQTQGSDLNVPQSLRYGSSNLLSRLKWGIGGAIGARLLGGSKNRSSSDGEKKSLSDRMRLKGREDVQEQPGGPQLPTDVVPGGEGGLGGNTNQPEHVFEHKDIFAEQSPGEVQSAAGGSALLKKTAVGRVADTVIKGGQKVGRAVVATSAAIKVAGQTSLKFAMADNETKVEMAKSGLVKAGHLVSTPYRAVKGKVQNVRDRAEQSVNRRATEQAQAEVFAKSDFNKVQFLAKQGDVQGLRKLNVSKLDLSDQEKGEIDRLKAALKKENKANIAIKNQVFREVQDKYGLDKLGGDTAQGKEAFEKYKKEIEALIVERQLEARKNYKSTVIMQDMAQGFDDKVAEIKETKVREIKTEHSIWNEEKGSETLTGLVNFAKNIRNRDDY